MGIYADSEEWADIVPIAQDDGGLNPLAAISYTEDYSEAMSYLRAVMARNEKSQRVLELTMDIIRMNPAHYTVWFGSMASTCCIDSPIADPGIPGCIEQMSYSSCRAISCKSSNGSIKSL